MPSGAKKRKAAKKKKEKEANNSSSTLSHGDDDLKVLEEKESDGGDTSSPTSQDHHNHQHPFTDGEDEMVKREDTSYVRSNVTENEPVVGADSIGESTQDATTEESNVIQIDWEINPEDYSYGENVGVEKIESKNKSHGGSSSSSNSSSSSSDDESHFVEKNIVVVESGKSKEGTPSVVTDSAGFDDSVKIADLPEVTHVTDGVLVMDAYNLAVGEPKEEADDPVVAELLSVNLVKPADLPDVTQVTGGVSVTEAYSLVVEEASKSVVETMILVDSQDVSKEVVRVNDSATVENPTSFSECESGLKQNGKHESSGISPAVMDMRSEPKEDKMSPKAIEYSAVSSVAMSLGVQEDDDKLPQSSCVKDSAVTECSDSQTLVVLAPRPVQTTSWTSCCGLFELFTGSSR
ncbi:Chitinase [Actinidia chinensis var. chinensis]|uniref:Chitinase n=1 Tax=Actinidia chinensis var. chinensis TaxID=1590841 RepID=A0A2R6Q6S0_ACTCC|nr:Chitinase [Actinidia chinensis var. chinensis]